MDLRAAANLVESAQKLENITQSPLSYSLKSLEPVMSRQCVDVHYNILTKNYFKKYKATGDLFQKAGAVLHNDFYWPMMQPYKTGNQPSSKIRDQIDQTWKNFRGLQDAALEAALSVQGNGWVMIMQDFQIQTVQNHVIKPGILWAIDIWEHATVDHNFNREKFFKDYWNIVNWTEIEQHLK
jgi:superoxide dismutase